jgi:prepilin-type processing-associated H-X9-DG protein
MPNQTDMGSLHPFQATTSAQPQDLRSQARPCASGHSTHSHPSPWRQYPTPADGFNRLELLIVVSVIGFLALMLLPAIAHDQSTQSRTFCRYRLGQLARALTVYAAEYNEWLPPNFDDGNNVPFHNWCGGQAGIGGAQEFNAELLRDPTRALLTPYFGGNITVYRCPMDRRVGNYQGTNSAWRNMQVPSARTVVLSGAVGTIYRSPINGKGAVSGPWLDGYNRYHGQIWYCYGKTSDFVFPGPNRTFTFIEEDISSINDGAFQNVGPNNPQVFRMIDWPLTSHDRACAISFADGHVEMHRWSDDRTIVYKKNVSISEQPGNVDIRWLAEHTTALISP